MTIPAADAYSNGRLQIANSWPRYPLISYNDRKIILEGYANLFEVASQYADDDILIISRGF